MKPATGFIAIGQDARPFWERQPQSPHNCFVNHVLAQQHVQCARRQRTPERSAQTTGSSHSSRRICISNRAGNAATLVATWSTNSRVVTTSHVCAMQSFAIYAPRNGKHVPVPDSMYLRRRKVVKNVDLYARAVSITKGIITGD